VARIPVRNPDLLGAARHYGLHVASCMAFDPESNAACESAIASFTTELVHRRSFRTRNQAREQNFRWIEGWYNARRRHSALEYLSPADSEARFHDRATDDALSGDLRPSPRRRRPAAVLTPERSVHTVGRSSARDGTERSPPRS
jgi:hypothetical protein